MKNIFLKKLLLIGLVSVYPMNTVFADNNAEGTNEEDIQVVLSDLMSDSSLQITNGWFFELGNWYYLKNGVMQTGWLQDGSNWYYLKENGVMQTGWFHDGSNWYYLKKSGVMQTGWLQDGSNWYYFKESGVMQTSWLQDGSNWYYFKESGVMRTSWLQDGSDWYFFQSNGVMQTNWLKDGSTWYYFQNNGKMQTEWLVDGRVRYYFHSDGKLANSEWINDGSNWYRIDGNGYMYIGWFQENNTWYFLKENGTMAQNELLTISNKGNRFDSSGKWLGVVSYSGGSYKVGKDIPAGKYVAIPNDDSLYFSVSKDSMHQNIVYNEFIDGQAFLEVKNGEFLKLERGYMLPLEGYRYESSSKRYSTGYYRVGIDIPEGEYRVNAPKGEHGYWSIGNLRGDTYVNDFFETSSYVTLKIGDILILKDAYINK